ncbi:hypothetical protein E1200_32780 [Actinomadura sp. GC306]|uniref:hypothetical protein n=1 Tax=Actinomadura sp. GC306 TaxID=2530367 RepID=UPI001048675C|nr:hypothetical protein [Actinomadura sp. GC306]TDC58913.1 hypothetical protein E1200_32780 [Actinomadura sp. GC306]
MAGRWITKNGRRIWIGDDGGGKIIVAGVAAIMMAGSSGVVGGAAGAGAGGASSVSAKNFKARKGDAKRSARKGDAEKAWRRLGMRRVTRSLDRRTAGCVRVTWGEVQQAAIRNPCTSLDRRLFAIADRKGNTALITVAWARFRSNGDRRRFQRVIDVYGTGDIKPLAASKLGLADIRFTGRYYHSIPKRTRLTVAEAEAVKGSFSPEVLDGFAQIAAELPSPPNRRRRR